MADAYDAAVRREQERYIHEIQQPALTQIRSAIVTAAQALGALFTILGAAGWLLYQMLSEEIDTLTSQAKTNVSFIEQIETVTDTQAELARIIASIDKQIKTELVALRRRVEDIEDPDYLEYSVWGMAYPFSGPAGGTRHVFQRLKRSKPCRLSVTVQFTQLWPGGGVDARSVKQRPNIQSSVVSDYRIFSFALDIPEHLGPGLWAYTPIFEAEDKYGCDPKPFSPPPVPFEIVDFAS